jgi:hypothetical protein
MKLPTFSSLLALSVLALAPAAHATDVTGLWVVSSSLAQTPVTLDCSVLQIGVKLEGWCEPESADATPTTLTGQIDKDTASWSYDLTVQGQPIHLAYQGAVSADQKMISGQLTYGTSSAGLTATRK